MENLVKNCLLRKKCLLLVVFILGNAVGFFSDSTAEEGVVNEDSLITKDERKFSLALYLPEEDLADIDHEEFGDWISMMPGFYPLDQGGYAQPFRGQIMGLSQQTVSLHFRGRLVEDHLLGTPEFGLIPPESITGISFNPISPQSSGAIINADLRVLTPSPPSSRIATRDGFYGLGMVDFDLAEKVSPVLVLNGGGRVSTYGGRLYNGKGYGLNLRTEVVWLDSNRIAEKSERIKGWWGISQSNIISGVPFENITYNRERYETDAVLYWHRFVFRTYGFQQRETYGSGDADSWDELGVAIGSSIGNQRLGAEVNLHGNAAQWRFKTMDWSTTSFGGAETYFKWGIFNALKLESTAGMKWSDDFYPERHLGVGAEVRIKSSVTLFANAAQHQRRPSRFESAADFAPETHYLPYSPVFYQYPDLNVKGNGNLENETYNKIAVGGRVDMEVLSGAVSFCQYRIEDPITWQLLEGKIRSCNAEDEEAAGGLGWMILRPFTGLQIGGTGSFLPLESGERRLFPEAMGHTWIQYRQLLFEDDLDLRLRVWEDFWGQRWFPVPGGWLKMKDNYVLSARIGARLYGFHIYWGINNILDEDYELVPGFPMMHKEEILGISWNFIN